MAQKKAPIIEEEIKRVRAQSRFVRGSARKARVVLVHIRGKSVVQARAALQFTPRAAAKDILATLESAAANAEANHDLDPNTLRVEEAYADEGPTLKRWQPRARGRAMRIRKRSCHLTVVLRHDPKLEAAVEASGGRRGAAAKATIEATQRARRTGKAVAPEAAVETDAPEAVEAAETTEAPAPKKRRSKAAAAAPEVTEETAAADDDVVADEAPAVEAEAPAEAEAQEEAPAAEAASDDDESTPKEEEV
jgi:large subunit ribosomal protein L22